jgi:hypothetical protein
MVLEHHGGHFRLEITSLDEFATFIAIIRAEELDGDTLKSLAARLNRSTHALDAAIQADTPTPPSKGV